MDNEEFIPEFIEESKVHLDAIEKGLLSMEKGSYEADAINEIFRAVHSIKGTAGFFALKNIVSLSHVMENLFGDIRNKKVKPSSEMVEVLLRANDALREMVLDIAASEEYEIESLMEAVSCFTSSISKEAEPNEATIEDEQSQAEGLSNTHVSKIMEDNIRHGHKIYRVSLHLLGNSLENQWSPVSVTKRAQTIGTVLESDKDTLIVSTVLSLELLAIALNIHVSRVTELRVHSKQKTTDIAEDKELITDSSNETTTDTKNLPDQILNGKDIPRETIKMEDTVRVNVSLLNQLLSLASEMVLGRNQLLRTMVDSRKTVPGLEAVLQNIDHLTTEMQEKIMQTRMQPVSTVFNKFPRIVRELSKALGKEVELKLEGTEVELDKSIIETLADPLTHLVRNSLDHGIEVPATRKQKGKRSQGTIIMRAYHEGGQVYVDIIDDGSGISIDKVKQKAWQKRIVTENELNNMTDTDTIQLLFKPGFSTAERVSDVSGRGVGMDVVKTNIDKLGGTIEIITSPDKGSTFRLKLPLTVAIVSSLIVEVMGQKFALPQVNLQEMVRVTEGDESRKIEYIQGAPVLRLRQSLLPLVDLAGVLGIETKKNIVEIEQYRKNKQNKDVVRILVLKSGTKRYGLIVDKIHDGEEILIKPLPSFLKKTSTYAGVTIMGDGKPALILDSEGIIKKANLKFIEKQLEKREETQWQRAKDIQEYQKLLLFQCSGPEVIALDMSMIARVEEITESQIERIGDREYIQFRGDALRVIRPERYLPIKEQTYTSEKMYVIIPKLVDKPIGLLVAKIHDSIDTLVNFDRESIKGKGIFGSAIIQSRIVLLLNLYDLFELAAPEDYRENVLQHAVTDKKTVLLVEDTPFFARMEQDYLEAAGYRVKHATNGKIALDILKQEHIDVIVSDIQMPVMNGIEFIKMVRADRELSLIPAIALTSFASMDDQQKGYESGFDLYECKLDKLRLLEKVKHLVVSGRKGA